MHAGIVEQIACGEIVGTVDDDIGIAQAGNVVAGIAGASGDAQWQIYARVSASVWNLNSTPEWTPNYWRPARCR